MATTKLSGKVVRDSRDMVAGRRRDDNNNNNKLIVVNAKNLIFCSFNSHLPLLRMFACRLVPAHENGWSIRLLAVSLRLHELRTGSLFAFISCCFVSSVCVCVCVGASTSDYSDT